ERTIALGRFAVDSLESAPRLIEREHDPTADASEIRLAYLEDDVAGFETLRVYLVVHEPARAHAIVPSCRAGEPERAGACLRGLLVNVRDQYQRAVVGDEPAQQSDERLHLCPVVLVAGERIARAVHHHDAARTADALGDVVEGGG